MERSNAGNTSLLVGEAAATGSDRASCAWGEGQSGRSVVVLGEGDEGEDTTAEAICWAVSYCRQN